MEKPFFSTAIGASDLSLHQGPTTFRPLRTPGSLKTTDGAPTREDFRDRDL